MTTVIENDKLQDGATAIGNGNAITMTNNDILNVEITGVNITTSTIIFEVASASGTFYSIKGLRLSDLTMASQTTTVAEIWQFTGLTGLKFRARISVLTGASASITVYGVVVD